MNGLRIFKRLVAVMVLTSGWASADLPLQDLQVFPLLMSPAGGALQARDGYFYGVSTNGGTSGANGHPSTGTIYRFAPGSQIEVLHSFLPYVDDNLRNIGGGSPASPLVEGPDGSLYGFTLVGGAYGMGVIFRYELNGTFTTLLDLSYETGLVLKQVIVSKTGDVYAVADRSGEDLNGGGRFFRIREGQYELLHTFQYSEGWQENDDVAPDLPNFLVEGADGRIYGTTTRGGVVGPKVNRYDLRDGPGVVFRLEEDDTLTFFDSFEDEGDVPHYLIANQDGSFYGNNRWGVVRMSADAEITTLWEDTRLDRYEERIPTFYGNFCERLIVASDGSIYFARMESVWGGRLCHLTLDGVMTPLNALAPEYFDYLGSGFTEGKDGFLYFVTMNVPSAVQPQAEQSAMRVPVAARRPVNLARGKTFRLQFADPLNGDQPPLAVADHVVLKKNKAGLIETSIDVLANDRDPDGDTLAVTSVTQPLYGTVQLEGGTLHYTPNDPTSIRSDECRYVVDDGRGGTASAVVTFHAPYKGRYSGRLKGESAGKTTRATYSLSVAANGKVSGNISVGKKSYPIKGQLGSDDRIRGSFGEKKKKGTGVIQADLGVTFTPKRSLEGEVQWQGTAGPVVLEIPAQK